MLLLLYLSMRDVMHNDNQIRLQYRKCVRMFYPACLARLHLQVQSQIMHLHLDHRANQMLLYEMQCRHLSILQFDQL